MTQEEKPKIIVITGPTATGKTSLGIRLAKKHNGEVISADSMQVYKLMDIGTAKPSDDEKGGVVHHMLDVVPPWEDYSAARYVREATVCTDDVISRNKLPIIVGGSGLYVDSLIRGRVFAAKVNPELRKILELRYDKLGGKAMLDELRRLDTKGAEKLHENDKKRIVRAFEVLETSDMPLSEHDLSEKSLPPRYDCIKIALSFVDREILYDRINRRVDDMMSRGLAREVASLQELGVRRNSTSMQAIGYKELCEALENKADIGTAVDKIKMESTRYAKRQLTWLRRDSSIHWILWDKAPDIERGISEIERLQKG